MSWKRIKFLWSVEGNSIHADSSRKVWHREYSCNSSIKLIVRLSFDILAIIDCQVPIFLRIRILDLNSVLGVDGARDDEAIEVAADVWGSVGVLRVITSISDWGFKVGDIIIDFILDVDGLGRIICWISCTFIGGISGAAISGIGGAVISGVGSAVISGIGGAVVSGVGSAVISGIGGAIISGVGSAVISRIGGAIISGVCGTVISWIGRNVTWSIISTCLNCFVSLIWCITWPAPIFFVRDTVDKEVQVALDIEGDVVSIADTELLGDGPIAVACCFHK